MTTYVQPPKQLIDVGEKGNANTGDIIYDGGVKVNEGLTALYNTFGDVRLWDTSEGVGSQTLHASGYYQKLPSNYYATRSVDPGSMHDIDTTAGSATINLPNPKKGECVEFINSNGSFGINDVIFQPQAGASIAGKTQLRINKGHSRVIFICTDETNNAARWDYAVTPMFGDFSVPINKAVEVNKTSSLNITLFGKGDYDGVKLMVAAEEVKAGTKERTLSEILVMVDPEDNKVYSDEYSVLFKNKKAFSIDFSVINNRVVATVSTTLDRIVFAIKSIETIKADL